MLARQDALKRFRQIPGVGKTIAEDFWNLGLRSLEDLKDKDPQVLYEALCLLQRQHVDRCMLYVFRCAIYYVNHTCHDPEKLKWWYWKD